MHPSVSGVIFSVVVSHTDDGLKNTLNSFSFSIKMGGSESILEDRIRIQNFFDRLEKWPELTSSVRVLSLWCVQILTRWASSE